MEPRIRYAETSDGVNIAYFTAGEGVPLIWMPNIMASFGSVTKAVECAVALQRAFAHWNTASGSLG